MTKKQKVIASVGLALAILFCVTIFISPSTAGAASKVVHIEGVGYNVNSSLADNLKSLINKRVSIILNSGETITGFVKEVGNHLVHIEKLEGQEYFDALLQIEKISAISTRFRTIQR